METKTFMEGYKTYAMIALSVLTPLVPLTGLDIPAEIITTISVVFGILAVIFKNMTARKRIKKFKWAVK